MNASLLDIKKVINKNKFIIFNLFSYNKQSAWNFAKIQGKLFFRNKVKWIKNLII